MADGIKLWQYSELEYHSSGDPEFTEADDPHDHIAYPADVARARERALEAARKVMKHRYDVFTSHAALMDDLFSALADLDAAEGGAG